VVGLSRLAFLCYSSAQPTLSFLPFCPPPSRASLQYITGPAAFRVTSKDGHFEIPTFTTPARVRARSGTVRFSGLLVSLLRRGSSEGLQTTLIRRYGLGCATQSGIYDGESVTVRHLSQILDDLQFGSGSIDVGHFGCLGFMLVVLVRGGGGLLGDSLLCNNLNHAPESKPSLLHFGVCESPQRLRPS